MSSDNDRLLAVKRVFGGEYTDDFNHEIRREFTEQDLKKVLDMTDYSAMNRWNGVDGPSQKKILARAQRLIRQGYASEIAVILALGILPKSIHKWPAKQRYQLADGRTAENIQKDLDHWFNRNHHWNGAN